jgi:hypothetical protein
VVWLAACSIGPIYAVPEVRATVMAAIAIAYALLTVVELWRGRGDGVCVGRSYCSSSRTQPPFRSVFLEAPLAYDRDTQRSGAAELVGETAIVQEGPAELPDNEDLRALCDRGARRSATLANNVERFSAAHASQPPCEGDRRT